MKIIIPINVENIIKVLENSGYEAYIVGGCVRDILLGKEPSDWDICTNATPFEVKNCFKKMQYHIIDTGIKHGTITIFVDNIGYEITTYRTESIYTDNRHPDNIKFVNDLKDDLLRRDFTINAMAYNSKTGLIDYFNGEQDLKMGLIKSVGNPYQRFSEDGLRIMRLLRISSTYNFKIDLETEKAAIELKDLLLNISKERINTEFCKLLCGEGAKCILMNFYMILSVIIPKIQAIIESDNCNLWEFTVNTIVAAPKDLIIRLTLLFLEISNFYKGTDTNCEIVKKIMKDLKFNNMTINQVLILILYYNVDILPTDKGVKKLLNTIGKISLKQLLQVKRARALVLNIDEEVLLNISKAESLIDKIIENKECFSLNDLKINGNDLINIGIGRGKIVGDILNKLLNIVIDEQIDNDKSQLLKMAVIINERHLY